MDNYSILQMQAAREDASDEAVGTYIGAWIKTALTGYQVLLTMWFIVGVIMITGALIMWWEDLKYYFFAIIALVVLKLLFMLVNSVASFQPEKRVKKFAASRLGDDSEAFNRFLQFSNVPGHGFWRKHAPCFCAYGASWDAIPYSWKVIMNRAEGLERGDSTLPDWRILRAIEADLYDAMDYTRKHDPETFAQFVDGFKMAN
jgi:hypothetical protein